MHKPPTVRKQWKLRPVLLSNRRLDLSREWLTEWLTNGGDRVVIGYDEVMLE